MNYNPYMQNPSNPPSGGKKPPKKKNDVWMTAVICIAAVIIVALTAVLVVLLVNNGNRNNNGRGHEVITEVPEGCIVINGVVADVGAVTDSDIMYFAVDKFSKALGYACIINEDVISIVTDTDIITLEIGSKEAKRKEIVTEATLVLPIGVSPYKNYNTVYIWSRDVEMLFRGATVEYDAALNATRVNVPGVKPQVSASAAQQPAENTLPETQAETQPEAQVQ